MLMFPKFVQVGLYFFFWGGGALYGGGRLIFGMLIGFRIWGYIFKMGLYTGDILTGFYSIGYGIEFNHFMKIFGNSKRKKTWKDPSQETDGNTGT